MLKTFMSNNTSYFYELITNQVLIENKRILVSGIMAYKAGNRGNFYSDDFCIINDISTDPILVENILNFLCSLKVYPLHVKDVIEDYFQQGILPLK